MFFRSVIRPLKQVSAPKLLTSCSQLVRSDLGLSPASSLLSARGYALKVGDNASLTKTYTESDVEHFADITLDHNPIHLDAEYAKGTRFGKPIVHGILTLG